MSLKASGNKCSLSDVKKIQTVLSWESSRTTVDLDLSAVLFDENGDIIDGVYHKKLKTTGVEHSGDVRNSTPTAEEKISINMEEIDAKVKLIVVIASSGPGNFLNDTDKATINVKSEKGNLMDLNIRTTDITSSYFVYKITKLDSGWEFENLSIKCDPEARFFGLFSKIENIMPQKMRKKECEEQAKKFFDFGKDAYINTNIPLRGTLTFGLGWDSTYGVSRRKYWLDGCIIYFGKYGKVLQHVDHVATKSKDGSAEYFPEDYKRGDKGDKIAEVFLGSVSSNVETIVFVATSAPDKDSIQKLRNPYARIHTSAGDVFKFAPSPKFVEEKSAIILCKLARSEGKWKFETICEATNGEHALWERELRKEIEKHIKVEQVPDCKIVEDELPIENCKSIGLNFYSMRDIEAIYSFSFGDYRYKEHKQRIVDQFQDYRKMNSTHHDFGLRSLSSFVPINLSVLDEKKITTVVYTVLFAEEERDEESKEGDTEDATDNETTHTETNTEAPEEETDTLSRDESEEPTPRFRQQQIRRPKIKFENENEVEIYSLEDQVKIAKGVYTDIKSEGSVVLFILYKREGKWKLKKMKDSFSFDSYNLKPTLISFKRYLTKTDERLLSQDQEIIINDVETLCIGFGVDGRRGNEQQRVCGITELVDHFSNSVGFAHHGHSDNRDVIFYGFNKLQLPGEPDDEQMVFKRSPNSIVKYTLCRIKPKSRRRLNESDVIYARVMCLESGRELCKINASASMLLNNYTPEDNVEEDSDNDDENLQPLMFCITQTKTGWKVKGCGIVTSDIIPNFVPDPPSEISVEVLRGQKLAAMDANGTSDPYVKVKLTEKNPRPRTKKQKRKTKIIKKTLNPCFNETFQFAVFSPEDVLTFKCMDHDTFKSHDFMGHFSVSVAEALRGGEGVSKWFELKPMKNEAITGSIEVRFNVTKREKR